MAAAHRSDHGNPRPLQFLVAGDEAGLRSSRYRTLLRTLCAGLGNAVALSEGDRRGRPKDVLRNLLGPLLMLISTQIARTTDPHHPRRATEMTTNELLTGPAEAPGDIESPHRARRLRWVLALLAAAQFSVAFDYTSVFVALPSIGHQMNLAHGQQQWVVAAYVVFFAGFLTLGGRAGDIFGARNVFIVSLVFFGGGSLISFFTNDFTVLVVSRAIQGIGAGLLDPSTLGLIGLSFPAGKLRNRAMAVWGTTGAVGLSFGVVVSGVVSNYLSWHWIFALNMPLAVIIGVGAIRLLPKFTTGSSGLPLNLVNALLATVTVASAVFGITRAADVGWSSIQSWGAFIVAAVAGVLWVQREKVGAAPLIPAGLLRNRTLVFGVFITGLYLMAFNSIYFLSALYLQNDQRYSALATGLALLPLALAMTAGNMITNRLANKYGVRLPLLIGLLVGTVGLVLLAMVTTLDHNLVAYLVVLIVAGIGSGMAFLASMMVGTADLKPENQGVGSALMTTGHHVGGVLGLSFYVLALGTGDNFFTAFLLAAAIAVVTAAFSAYATARKSDQAR
jgi:MFS family permease